jgi:hypothetical protein
MYVISFRMLGVCVYVYICIQTYNTVGQAMSEAQSHIHVYHTHMYACIHADKCPQQAFSGEHSDVCHVLVHRFQVCVCVCVQIDVHTSTRCMYVCMYIRMYVCIYVCTSSFSPSFSALTLLRLCKQLSQTDAFFVHIYACRINVSIMSMHVHAYDPGTCTYSSPPAV